MWCLPVEFVNSSENYVKFRVFSGVREVIIRFFFL